MTIRPLTALITWCLSSFCFTPAAQADGAMSYARDIAPLLQKNCIACHRAKQAEGGLSLETFEAIQAGGDSGPFVTAGNPEESSFYLRITDDDDPMPPEGNTVGAKRLSDAEQELVRRWILEGAEIDRIRANDSIEWQPIPKSILSSFSLATTPDNRFVVIGRANRVAVVDMNTALHLTNLVDDQLSQPGVADVDFVQAIAVSPHGDRIATGGFKTVRIWERVPERSEVSGPFSSAAGIIAASPNGAEVAMVNAIGDIEIWDHGGQERRLSIPGTGAVVDLVWRSAETLVLGLESGDVRVCSTSDMAVSTTLKLEHPVAQLDQSPDGRFIVVLGPDSQLKMYQDLAEQSVSAFATIKDGSSVLMIDSSKVVIGTSSGTAVVVDLNTGQPLRKLNHAVAITALAANQSGTMVATGGIDGSVKLWNLDDGKPLHTLSGDAEMTLEIAKVRADLKREESWLAVLNQQTDQLRKLLEREDAALAKVVEAREKAAKAFADTTKQRDDLAQQIRQSERNLAAAQKQIELNSQSIVDSEAMIAKFQTQVQTIETEIAPLTQRANVASKEVQAAKARVEEAMRLLAVAQESERKQLALVQQKEAQRTAATTSLRETTDKLDAAKAAKAMATKNVAAETGMLTKLREKLAASEKDVATKKADLAEREQALATSKTTRDQAAANLPKHDDTIRAQSNRLIELQRHHKRWNQRINSMPPVTAIAFSDDDSKVAICDRNGSIRMFDAASGKPLDRFAVGSTSDFGSLARSFFAEDNLVVSRHGGVSFRVATKTRWVLSKTIGGLGSNLISDRVTALDFDPDGRSLALGSGIPSRSGQVLIVDALSGAKLREFADVHSDSVLCVRFSPDGQTLASSSADKTIRLIDVDSSKIVGSLDGHTHHVLSVAWKRDGRLLASGSADATIKTWDVHTGQRQRTISGFGDEVTVVSFLGDTTQVISACADGQVRVHETNNGSRIRNFSATGDALFTLGLGGDEGQVFASGQNGSLHVWKLEVP